MSICAPSSHGSTILPESGTPLLLVVGGLHEVPREDTDLVSAILQMLPRGSPGFHNVISGDHDSLSGSLPKIMSQKSLQLVEIVRSEAEHFLDRSHDGQPGTPSELLVDVEVSRLVLLLADNVRQSPLARPSGQAAGLSLSCEVGRPVRRAG